MAFERKESKGLDGRQPGQPHPDWEINKSYFEDILLNPKIAVLLFNTKVKCMLRGLQKIGEKSGVSIYDVYTHVEISFDKFDRQYVDRISFHIPHDRFKKEVLYRFKID